MLRAAARSVFSVFFPADCRICRIPLEEISRLPVCDPCLQGVQPLQSETLCESCGESLASQAASQGDRRLCGMCRRAEPPFARAAAYGSYEGGLRELIHLLKYENVRPAAEVLGRMLAEVLEMLRPDFGPEPPLLTPVPLHRGRLRERGFNQAELIARAARKQFARSSGVLLPLASDALARRRETGSQTGLTNHQRRENVRAAFAVSDPQQVAGKVVVLVDDVFTTGTTVAECARVLRRAGAERVLVATVARVMKTEATGAKPPQPVVEPVRAAAAHSS